MGADDGEGLGDSLVLLIGNYENDGQESMLRFARTLHDELPKRGVFVELIRPQPFFGRLFQTREGIGKWLGYIDKFIVFPFVLRRKVASFRCETVGGFQNQGARRRNVRERVVVHICDHSNAIYTRYLTAVTHLVTCNDLLAVRSALGEFPQNRPKIFGRLLQSWILAGLKRAQRITCISHATRNDVLRITRRSTTDVTVTYMGQNYAYAPMARSEATEAVVELLGHPEQQEVPAFILHVGGDQWYKNRLGTLEIYASVHRRLTREGTKPPVLIMVGPKLSAKQERILSSEASSAVHVFQSVSNEVLRALYSAAELLLFPSLEEGFGWPIVEAQACGCPVVTTGKAPMTEVGGDAAAYVSEANLSAKAKDEAAEIVLSVLGESGRDRTQRVNRGLANARKFSTRVMIDGYIAIYETMLRGKSLTC